ncbi:hypothetical protein [Poritiphilus flavus]|uniref:DUF1579 domain-containing protein n=1 Tax=Poritiphilus flavus TaxID=2697053 RepID=A0A6L9EH78_9FLAO|nr:hypothetical protein [Poritiphilus flavus]NAS14035.1 hypothetical protein [Poritiphilus flavus]
MKKSKLLKVLGLTIVLSLSQGIAAQDAGIKDLDFLIGTWETREDNVEEGWWETSTREINYALKENYIEIRANSIDSNGREREYFWYINYNKKTKRFEMVSMFSNWYQSQFDILEWNRKERKLTIRNEPDSEKEFRIRFGEMVFNESFDEYTWKGENKYGDPNKPSIWRYVETGVRIK